MFVSQFIPRALAACFVLAILTLNVAAQTQSIHPRPTTQSTTSDGDAQLENDVFLVSEAEPMTTQLTKPALLAPSHLPFNQIMMTAIDQRIGAPYVYGATGPRVFDCSGFVWSVFNAAGIPFERTSARSFWVSFSPVLEDEKYRFGTLVFFNHLKHVGIVADENGFYHASTSEGVKYSPFNEYWAKRITGFRRVPLPTTLSAE
ncbi:MAG: C40 family peptidase [Acidobacteriota bacterium]|jgi:cell wall-associated NlpC family hydrolase|nr:C40 family peptidase [Acidobacteriota bacterium]